MVKQLRQVAGVASVKVEDYRKGIFAITPQRGATLAQPALRDAVRKSGFTLLKLVPPPVASSAKPLPSPAQTKTETDASGKLFTEAREAFRQGDHQNAVRLARLAGLENPQHAQVQQFLSLTLFSVGKYSAAASAAHKALHRGRYWDWKALSQYYRDPRQYSAQLRALEKYVRENPSTGQAHFLLGYHYLMLGHQKAARDRLVQAAELSPQDELLSRLLEQLEKGVPLVPGKENSSGSPQGEKP